MGSFEPARGHLEAGLSLYDRGRHHQLVMQYVQDPGVVGLVRSGLALWCLGYPDRASARVREAIALAESLSHPFSQTFALSFAAMFHELRRDHAAAREAAEAALKVSLLHGFTAYVLMGTLLRGAAIGELDDPESGLQEVRSGMESAKASGAALMRAYSFGLLARNCARLGRRDEGRAMAEQGLETADRTGEHFYDAELRRIEGLLFLGDRASEARAESSFLAAIDIAERQQARSWKLRASTSLARLLRDQGRLDEAHGLIDNALAPMSEGFETPDVKEARELSLQLSLMGS